MGADQSKPLSEWSSDDVAVNMASLGDQYVKYGPAIREHQVNGASLAALHDANEMQDLLGKLGITSRLHWRVLGKKLSVLRGDAPMSTVARHFNRRSTYGTTPTPITTTTSPNSGAPFHRSQTVPEPSSRDQLLRQMQLAAGQEQKEHEELVKREATLRSQIATLRT